MADDRMVLMSCCAPCSAAAVKQLVANGGQLAILFYNPNIYPKAEYDRRLAEQKKLCEKYEIECAEGPWDHDAWLREIKGLENEPERGGRCARCFAMRARFGAKWAAEHGYGRIASVFGASPRKNQRQVDEAFSCAAENYPLSIVHRQFAYAPEPGMYRQKYCGCEFSETYEKAAENGE